MGEVGLPSARSRAADAGDRRHGDGVESHPGDAAAVRYADLYAARSFAEFLATLDAALHNAKHRAATDTFGFEPGCVTLRCYASSNPRNATAAPTLILTPFPESVTEFASSKPASATLATSSRLPPRSAVSPASDMSVSAVIPHG